MPKESSPIIDRRIVMCYRCKHTWFSKVDTNPEGKYVQCSQCGNYSMVPLDDYMDMISHLHTRFSKQDVLNIQYFLEFARENHLLVNQYSKEIALNCLINDLVEIYKEKKTNGTENRSKKIP